MMMMMMKIKEFFKNSAVVFNVLTFSRVREFITERARDICDPQRGGQKVGWRPPGPMSSAPYGRERKRVV